MGLLLLRIEVLNLIIPLVKMNITGAELNY